MVHSVKVVFSHFIPNYPGEQVELSFDSSNFYDDCEAVVNFEKVLNNRAEGQYRKKNGYVKKQAMHSISKRISISSDQSTLIGGPTIVGSFSHDLGN